MNIIIAGCGKVGYTLAKQMTDEGHDITVIDPNVERLQPVLTDLDVQGVVGSCTSVRLMQEAGIRDADLFIAVTAQDEINLLGCLVAKKHSHCKTVARVRDPEYFAEKDYLRECLGISMIINPEYYTAKEIAHLIQTPAATEVDTFAKGKVDLMKIQIPEGSILDHLPISSLSQKVRQHVLICALIHDHKIVIPDGNTVLQSGDTIYVILPPEEIQAFCRDIGIKTRVLKDVMIAGGSKIAYYLNRHLQQTGARVKIIEINRSRCEFLSSALDGAMIIEGDATDHDILKEEGLAQMDAFVALTNVDEENVFLSLFANHVAPNCKKITKNNHINLTEIADDLPIGSVVSPKAITAEYISQYVRSLNNSTCSNVEAVYQLVDNQVEALEFKIKEESSITGIPLQDLKLRQDVLVCCIVRDGRVITPGGRDMMLKGDTVVVVTTKRGLSDIRNILV